MKAFFILMMAALCSSAKSTSSCNCQHAEDFLLSSQLDIPRDPWDFLTSPERLYLMYMPRSLKLDAIQCVISEWKGIVIDRLLLQRTVLWKNKGIVRNKTVAITMTDPCQHTPQDSFVTTAFDIVVEFKTMYADKQCLILQIRKRNEVSGLRKECAYWAKDGYKDNPLRHCRYMYLLFCGGNYREVYNKEACKNLVKKSTSHT
uniref:Putative salivary lipocalin n=1 Tax=Ixodes ricinus TaxID=34613 RepID=A0A0K8RGB9_IXORI